MMGVMGGMGMMGVMGVMRVMRVIVSKSIYYVCINKLSVRINKILTIVYVVNVYFCIVFSFLNKKQNI